MAKPLYQQYQEMGEDLEWPDFQVFLAWARSQGYDGTQAVVRENKNHPWGEDNCSLKADGKRPSVAPKGGKKPKAKAKAKAKSETKPEPEPEPEPEAEGEKSNPEAEGEKSNPEAEDEDDAATIAASL